MLQVEIDPDDLPEVARFVAGEQADPATAIGYLENTPAAVEDQLRALGTKGLVTARRDGRVVGVLAAEWDDVPPRCWWHGPFVAAGEDWAEVTDAVLACGRALLPTTVTEEETFADQRHAWLADFATRNGFVAQAASVSLGRSLEIDLPPNRPGARPLDALPTSHRHQLADLHDRLFPDTHTPGRRVVDGGHHHVLAVVEGAAVVGYVAVQLQADGEGYVDFLGVAIEARQRGLGSGLVAAACHELHARGCRRAHLTVRVDNTAARQVYAANGFQQEQVLVPYRRGFRLA